MPATTLSVGQQATAMVSAADQAGIPVSMLTSVYGMETALGQNIATSSAGAQGAFQFIPGTAASWGYPMTNTPTAAQFQAQATAAANYLASLYKQVSGSSPTNVAPAANSTAQANWNKAFELYSGGGYDATKAEQTLAQAGPNNTGLFDAIIQAGIKAGTGDTSLSGGTPLTTGAQQLANTVGGAGDLISFFTSGANWLRL